MEKIQILEHNAVRVLTTKQIAEFYNTEPRTISDNFNRNQERFAEGKHFFTMEGEELRQMKATNPLLADSSNLRINKLYLWTEKGCARHAKILSTDKAWDVFEELEDTYFRVHAAKPLTSAEMHLQSAQILVHVEQQLNNHEQRLHAVERAALPIRFKNAYEFTQQEIRLRMGDVFEEFLKERIGRVLESKVYFMTVFDEYKQYCQDKGVDTLTKKAFSHLMRYRGYESDRNQKGIFYRNITLKIAPAESEQAL